MPELHATSYWTPTLIKAPSTTKSSLVNTVLHSTVLCNPAWTILTCKNYSSSFFLEILSYFFCVFWNKNKMPQWISSCFCIKDTVSPLFYMYGNPVWIYSPASCTAELISKALRRWGGWRLAQQWGRQGSSATFQKNESKWSLEQNTWVQVQQLSSAVCFLILYGNR